MRLTRASALTLPFVLVAAGCGNNAVTPTTTVAPAPVFSTCDNIECANLTVPIDRSGAIPGTMKLGVYRRRGSAPQTQPLIVHPGGPGADVKELVGNIDQFLGTDVEKFDVIGLATRATPDVTPIDCVDSLDDFVNASTDDAAARRIADGCMLKSPQFVGHAGTLDTVDDLRQLVKSLGLEQVDYLGWSYGATVGAAWVMTHPENLSAVVLDAPADPGLPWPGQLRATLRAQQANFGKFLDECAVTPSCGLGKDPLAKVREAASGPREVQIGLAAELSMYDADMAKFVEAVKSAVNGDATHAQAAVDARLGRTNRGKDDGGMEAQAVVQCSDVSQADARAAVAAAESFEPATIRIGLGAALDRVCMHLPEPPRPLGRVTAADGARNADVLVVATRLDAAAPAGVSVGMAHRLGWGIHPVNSAVHLAVGFDQRATAASLGCLLQSVCH